MKVKSLIVTMIIMVMLLPVSAGGNQDSGSDGPITLSVWHDLGKKGDAWLSELEKLYNAGGNDVVIESVTYPTQQWIEKSIISLTTNTAPDIIFNNYERVIKVEQQTGMLSDLSNEFSKLSDTSFLSEQDLNISHYGGKMLIYPVQRVQMAFGVRKSWLEKSGKDFPVSWEDTLELAEFFTNGDPDGNGEIDTYGFALEAANPRDLIHMVDLFTFGSGIRHSVIDPDGNIVIGEIRRKEILDELMKVYREYKYTPSDTINYSFTEMYQVIEGSRAGMFRVGDWNVGKWDGADVLDGDYLIGPWPAFRAGDKNAVVIGGMRGAAVPENAPNKAAAVDFLNFMLSSDAQRESFKLVGASVRGDWELPLSEHQKFFAQPAHNLIAYDFPESIHPFYPQIEEIYHKALLNVMADNSVNLDDALADAERDILDYIKENN